MLKSICDQTLDYLQKCGLLYSAENETYWDVFNESSKGF